MLGISAQLSSEAFLLIDYPSSSKSMFVQARKININAAIVNLISSFCLILPML